MEYERLLSFGDFIKTSIKCNPQQILNDIQQYEWKKYNPKKDINRYGLSITSLDGEINGIDLDSLYEYNSLNNTSYNETHFNTLTSVYYGSKDIQKIVDPFRQHIGRSHILNLKPGGYFPIHRDHSHFGEQLAFRIIVPLVKCNPPNMYFMLEDKPLYFDHGYAYFLNTNKAHSVFAMKDTYFIVLNIKSNADSHKIVIDNLSVK